MKSLLVLCALFAIAMALTPEESESRRAIVTRYMEARKAAGADFDQAAFVAEVKKDFPNAETIAPFLTRAPSGGQFAQNLGKFARGDFSQTKANIDQANEGIRSTILSKLKEARANQGDQFNAADFRKQILAEVPGARELPGFRHQNAKRSDVAPADNAEDLKALRTQVLSDMAAARAEQGENFDMKAYLENLKTTMPNVESVLPALFRNPAALNAFGKAGPAAMRTPAQLSELQSIKEHIDTMMKEHKNAQGEAFDMAAFREHVKNTVPGSDKLARFAKDVHTDRQAAALQSNPRFAEALKKNPKLMDMVEARRAAIARQQTKKDDVAAPQNNEEKIALRKAVLAEMRAARTEQGEAFDAQAFREALKVNHPGIENILPALFHTVDTADKEQRAPHASRTPHAPRTPRTPEQVAELKAIRENARAALKAAREEQGENFNMAEFRKTLAEKVPGIEKLRHAAHNQVRAQKFHEFLERDPKDHPGMAEILEKNPKLKSLHENHQRAKAAKQQTKRSVPVMRRRTPEELEELKTIRQNTRSFIEKAKADAGENFDMQSFRANLEKEVPDFAKLAQFAKEATVTKSILANNQKMQDLNTIREAHMNNPSFKAANPMERIEMLMANEKLSDSFKAHLADRKAAMETRMANRKGPKPSSVSEESVSEESVSEVAAMELTVKEVPLNKKGDAPQDACSTNPCGSGETCCATPSGAGCCPDPSACCCPDQAHCCPGGTQCVCTGTCPGPNCSCSSCTTSGGACENTFF